MQVLAMTQQRQRSPQAIGQLALRLRSQAPAGKPAAQPSGRASISQAAVDPASPSAAHRHGDHSTIRPHRRRWLRRRLAPILLLLLSLGLNGCLKRISGTYRDSTNVVSLDFQRDGKVYAKIFGVPMVGDYEERGNKIIFKNAEGDIFIDIIDNDTLSMSHPLSSFTGEVQLKRQQGSN